MSLTHSGYMYCFFPIMPNKSTIFIKLLSLKMIVYIINKDHICKLCVFMHAFEK